MSPKMWTLQAGSGVFRNMGTSELANVAGPAAKRDTPRVQMLRPSVSSNSGNAIAQPCQWDFLGAFNVLFARAVYSSPVRAPSSIRDAARHKVTVCAKNRIRSWGRRLGVQTNHRRSWTLKRMKTAAASVTIDALATPIGYSKSRRTAIS
jgi:hypothetical protein